MGPQGGAAPVTPSPSRRPPFAALSGPSRPARPRSHPVAPPVRGPAEPPARPGGSGAVGSTGGRLRVCSGRVGSVDPATRRTGVTRPDRRRSAFRPQAGRAGRGRSGRPDRRRPTRETARGRPASILPILPILRTFSRVRSMAARAKSMGAGGGTRALGRHSAGPEHASAPSLRLACRAASASVLGGHRSRRRGPFRSAEFSEQTLISLPVVRPIHPDAVPLDDPEFPNDGIAGQGGDQAGRRRIQIVR